CPKRHCKSSVDEKISYSLQSLIFRIQHRSLHGLHVLEAGASIIQLRMPFVANANSADDKRWPPWPDLGQLLAQKQNLRSQHARATVTRNWSPSSGSSLTVAQPTGTHAIPQKGDTIMGAQLHTNKP